MAARTVSDPFDGEAWESGGLKQQFVAEFLEYAGAVNVNITPVPVGVRESTVVRREGQEEKREARIRNRLSELNCPKRTNWVAQTLRFFLQFTTGLQQRRVLNSRFFRLTIFGLSLSCGLRRG